MGESNVSKDDLINSILGSKPPLEKAEAFSTEGKEQKYEEPLKYRRVGQASQLKSEAVCGMCGFKLAGNSFAWYAEGYWWCVPCLENHEIYVSKEDRQ